MADIREDQSQESKRSPLQENDAASNAEPDLVIPNKDSGQNQPPLEDAEDRTDNTTITLPTELRESLASRSHPQASTVPPDPKPPSEPSPKPSELHTVSEPKESLLLPRPLSQVTSGDSNYSSKPNSPPRSESGEEVEPSPRPVSQASTDRAHRSSGPSLGSASELPEPSLQQVSTVSTAHSSHLSRLSSGSAQKPSARCSSQASAEHSHHSSRPISVTSAVSATSQRFKVSSQHSTGQSPDKVNIEQEEEQVPKTEGVVESSPLPEPGFKGSSQQKKAITPQNKETCEQIRRWGRERCAELAKPKLPKSQWWTSLYPDVKWGTQDMMFPIPKSALYATPSNRVVELAQPKNDFQKGTIFESRPLYLYSMGRPSQIWEITGAAKSAQASEKILKLAEPIQRQNIPNRPMFEYSCGRPSTIWVISNAAKTCEAQPRTVNLAMPRPLSKDFQLPRSIQTQISPLALKGNVLNEYRLSQLCLPKKRGAGQFQDAVWKVNSGTLNATASARTVELARPRGFAEGFQPPRLNADVSKAARQAVASARIEELARPIERETMDLRQFNPDAFIVKPLALKGTFPDHVLTLAEPINR